MKRFIVSFSTIALLSASTAFAACALPNGESNDGTLAAPGMLPQCDERGADAKVESTQSTVASSEATPTAAAQKFSNDKLSAVSRNEVTN